jgi:hypothetical protein
MTTSHKVGRRHRRKLDIFIDIANNPVMLPDKNVIMEASKSNTPTRTRVARHRTKSAAGGSRRVEVTVPAGDAPFVKAIAGVLRAGGEEALRVKEALRPVVSSRRAETGAELVAFFRNSPLVGAELEIERDKSTGRSADLG